MPTKRPGLRAIAIVPLFLVSLVPARAQQLSSDSERFNLHGKVLNPSSGEPISGALILIDGQQAQFTADDGTFNFRNLTRGSHDLAPARKPGFFDPFQVAQGQSSLPFSPTRALEVPFSGDFNLTLIPEAIIYGEVKSELGEPAEGVTVRARRWQVENGRRSLAVGGTAATVDDEGKFRIAELLPGDYQISFLPVSQGWRNVEKVSPHHQPEQGYGTLFYPGVTDAESSTIVYIRAGSQLHITQSLRRESLFQVSGTLHGAVPGAGVDLTLTNTSGDAVQRSVHFDEKTGQFQIPGVPAGNYLLQAYSQVVRPGSQEAVPLTATLPIILRSDFSAANLTLSRGISIPVQIRDETSQESNGRPYRVVLQLSAKDFSQLSTSVMAPDFGPNGEQHPAAIKDIATGLYTVEPLAQFRGYVSSVRCGSLDLLREDLLISPGSAPAPIEVTFRDDGAQLHVTVVDHGEPGAPFAGVILYSEESPRTSQLMQLAGGNAEFMLEQIPPGYYFLIAVPAAEHFEFRNPLSMSKYLPHATAITLNPGSKIDSRVDFQTIQDQSE